MSHLFPSDAVPPSEVPCQRCTMLTLDSESLCEWCRAEIAGVSLREPVSLYHVAFETSAFPIYVRPDDSEKGGD